MQYDVRMCMFAIASLMSALPPRNKSDSRLIMTHSADSTKRISRLDVANDS